MAEYVEGSMQVHVVVRWERKLDGHWPAVHPSAGSTTSAVQVSKYQGEWWPIPAKGLGLLLRAVPGAGMLIPGSAGGGLR